MVKLAFEFIVLTGARSGEVRGALWSEFDANFQQWVIPGDRMKSGREHRVPLATRAKGVLREALRLKEPSASENAGKATSELVFPNPGGKAYSDMVFTQLLRRLELPYTMHGFSIQLQDLGDESNTVPRRDA
jgi:integrase